MIKIKIKRLENVLKVINLLYFRKIVSNFIIQQVQNVKTGIDKNKTE